MYKERKRNYRKSQFSFFAIFTSNIRNRVFQDWDSTILLYGALVRCNFDGLKYQKLRFSYCHEFGDYSEGHRHYSWLLPYVRQSYQNHSRNANPFLEIYYVGKSRKLKTRCVGNVCSNKTNRLLEFEIWTFINSGSLKLRKSLINRLLRVTGSWPMAQGWWLMPRGSWLKAHGSWPRKAWRWAMNLEPWAMNHKPLIIE